MVFLVIGCGSNSNPKNNVLLQCRLNYVRLSPVSRSPSDSSISSSAISDEQKLPPTLEIKVAPSGIELKTCDDSTVGVQDSSQAVLRHGPAMLLVALVSYSSDSGRLERWPDFVLYQTSSVFPPLCLSLGCLRERRQRVVQGTRRVVIVASDNNTPHPPLSFWPSASSPPSGRLIV
ncbi:hypothetical protein RRG08_045211 [Elysia crispata]|uniref:Uncharacterized protein n=1 Tax=Elysia crispata TaxID=231223 RepID=A0AAE1A1F4_9GAST|nr:hypothetical protein RRG08_045211 [Elysia crispata]